MNSKTTLFIVSILAFVLLANVNVGTVFATGGLDDEEEEEAIEELQNSVAEINNSLDAINLNLTSGPNDIQANCPSVEEIVEEVVENITNPTPEEPVEQPTCPFAPVQNNVTEPVEQQQPPTTVIPPVEAATPEQNNETQQQEECQPIPEQEAAVVEENETSSELEPIICPLNGNLLGYTNTTSGEQLPISAVEEQNNGTIPFLPPIEIPTEEPEPTIQNQTVTTTTTEQPELPPCGNVTQQQAVPEVPTTNNNVTIQDEQEIATIEFEASCGCFVIDKTPEEVTEGNGSGGGESVEQGLSE